MSYQGSCEGCLTYYAGRSKTLTTTDLHSTLGRGHNRPGRKSQSTHANDWDDSRHRWIHHLICDQKGDDRVRLRVPASYLYGPRPTQYGD